MRLKISMNLWAFFGKSIITTKYNVQSHSNLKAITHEVNIHCVKQCNSKHSKYLQTISLTDVKCTKSLAMYSSNVKYVWAYKVRKYALLNNLITQSMNSNQHKTPSILRYSWGACTSLISLAMAVCSTLLSQRAFTRLWVNFWKERLSVDDNLMSKLQLPVQPLSYCISCRGDQLHWSLPLSAELPPAVGRMDWGWSWAMPWTSPFGRSWHSLGCCSRFPQALRLQSPVAGLGHTILLSVLTPGL